MVICVAPVHPDPCYCPQSELSIWLQKAKCPTSNPQIELDLNPFHDIDFNVVLNRAIELFYNPGAHSFCHYVVKNNEVFLLCILKRLLQIERIINDR